MLTLTNPTDIKVESNTKCQDDNQMNQNATRSKQVDIENTDIENTVNAKDKNTDSKEFKNNLLTDPKSPNHNIKEPPLHVVLVTETWYPDVNGVAMSLYQLMSELVHLGHKVSLIRPEPKLLKNNTKAQNNQLPDQLGSKLSEDNNASEIKFAEIHVKGLPIPRYPDLQFGMPAYQQISQTLKSQQPDIVHIATEGPLGLAALIAAKRQKLPVTTGYHTQFHDFSKHFGLGVVAKPLMAYFKWFHNWSDATCVPSQKTENDLSELGFERIRQVGRGVDIERFHPSRRSDELRESWGALKHHTVLIMVSRLSPEKGVDVVIESFKALQSAQLNRATKLVIVGDGPDKARLETLAASSDDDIIFTGAKTGIELAEHYASGDAFVFASQVETFGNVVTEAMASGLPVYAFDDAAAGLLVTKESGALAPFGNKAAFIEMVSNLPKMKQLHEQGQCAHEIVAGFSWQRPAMQMLDMIKLAIKAHAKSESNAKEDKKHQQKVKDIKSVSAKTAQL